MMDSSQIRPDSPGLRVNDRLRAAISAFDDVNAADPNREFENGEAVAKELVYSRRMRLWLDRLYPDASEALRLAACCQHIERWVNPRKSYPAGRAGYLKWRRELSQFHAERAGGILRDIGYPENLVSRVQSLVRKEKLKRDAEAQALEDVACVVFLAYHFASFSAQHEPAKVVEILRKTWAKMSPLARDVAMDLPLDAPSQALLTKALADRKPSSGLAAAS